MATISKEISLLNRFVKNLTTQVTTTFTNKEKNGNDKIISRGREEFFSPKLPTNDRCGRRRLLVDLVRPLLLVPSRAVWREVCGECPDPPPPPPPMPWYPIGEMPCFEGRSRGQNDDIGVLCRPRVAIIGAGIAGLSAAARLIQTGIRDVRVFEATHRAGGRVNTAKMADDTLVELGAEWIAGGNIANPLYILANREGLLERDVDMQDAKNILCITCEGTVICSDTCCLAKKIFNKIRGDAARLFKMGRGHGSVSSFVGKRSRELLSSLPDDSAREHLERLLMALHNNVRTRWGAELGKMSSLLYGSYAEVPGVSVRPGCGMIRALRPLIDTIPQDRILCNAPVHRLQWNNSRARVIVCHSGDQEYCADFAILAVPLGVLKHGHKAFFCPELPFKKIKAIENIGFGHLTKIFMKYDKKFWGSERTSLRTVWRLRDWADRRIFWIKGISNIEVKEDVLAATVAGCEALAVEEAPLDRVARELSSVIRNFTCCSFIPDPIDVVRSFWNGHPRYRGAGSFMSINTKPEDLTNLKAPLPMDSTIEAKVLFAGEATWPGQFSSAHGARLSGVAAADKIIAITREVDGVPCNKLEGQPPPPCRTIHCIK